MSGLRASAALAKAVHAALAADVVVKSHLGQPPRLYDQAPEDPIFPYLSYGEIKSENIGADGMVLFAHTMSLHVWSRYAGRAEVLQIMDAVATVLDKSRLTLSGSQLVSAHVLFADTFRAQDGHTRHGLIRFHAITQD